MGTLSALLHASASAIVADQRALGATAENISNQNTAGYTRRVITFSPGDSVLVGGQSTSSGVNATIAAQRDGVLQSAVLQATEASSASSSRLTSLNHLQSLFTLNSDGDDAAGIGAAIGTLFSGASALAAAPNDPVARQTAWTNLQAFANTMNRTASQIASQSAGLNQQAVSSVAQVNGLLASIASLNASIVQAGNGTDTSTLQDQRDLAVTELSRIMDVHTVTVQNGSTDLSLSDGTPLVSGATVTPLGTATSGQSVRVISGTTDVSSSIRGGSLGGILQVSNTDLPAVTARLDALGAAVASAVNTQNALGTDAIGNTGGDIFSGTTAATLRVTISDGESIAASPDGSNAAALADLNTQKLVGGLTATGALSAMITSLGQTAAAASTSSAADAAVLTQTSNQLANVSGVSLDTEAANLTQYQRSYQAAAKVLAIANELLAQAINLGTATPVN